MIRRSAKMKVWISLIVAFAFVGTAFFAIGYPFFFRGPLAPLSLDVDPAEGRVWLDSQITLELRGSWSREKVGSQLSISPAVRLNPEDIEVEHIARLPWHEGLPWAKTRISINQDRKKILAPETQYQLKVGDGHRFTFTTISVPEIVGVDPPEGSAGVTIHSPVAVYFHGQLDWSLPWSEYIRTEPPHDLAFAPDTEKNLLLITPGDGPWKNSTAYKLTISKELPDKFGHPLKGGITIGFSTEPPVSVIGAAPAGEHLSIHSGVNVVFDRPPLPEAGTGSVQISPPAPGSFSWENDTTLVWQPERLEYSTVYRISVGGEGSRADPIHPYSWQFRTVDPPVALRVVQSSEIPIRLKAEASGGTGVYSYQWSTGETSEEIPVNLPPRGQGAFSVRVTSGDQGASDEIAVTAPTLAQSAVAFAGEGCPYSWAIVVEGVCFGEETLPGPVEVYVARIDAKNPVVSVRSRLAGEALGGARTISSAASGAAVAINGDFFYLSEDGYFTLGPVACCGMFFYQPDRSWPVLAVANDGSSWVGNSQQLSNSLLPDLLFALGGSPILIQDGMPAPLSGEGRDPRTAIGVDGRGAVYLVVVDGRSQESLGMTLGELQVYLSAFGLIDALNLDGGGSSTMVVLGEVRNRPSDGKEREVAALVEAVLAR